MKPRHAAALALVGWYLAVPLSAYPQCADIQTLKRADAEADTLKTWPTIHDSFLRYHQCDDGEVWEGYSESVVSTLANRWDQLPALGTLTAHDDSFRDFVLRHIDATTSREDLAVVVRNAERRCPNELAKLCSEIGGKALSAEAQMESLDPSSSHVVP